MYRMFVVSVGGSKFWLFRATISNPQLVFVVLWLVVATAVVTGTYDRLSRVQNDVFFSVGRFTLDPLDQWLFTVSLIVFIKY